MAEPEREADLGRRQLGDVHHEADIEDERYDAPEAAGLDAIIRGLGEVHGDDRLIALSAAIYDGLLADLAATTAN